MDFLFFLILIVWVIISVVSKKKKQEAEAAKERARSVAASAQNGKNVLDESEYDGEEPIMSAPQQAAAQKNVQPRSAAAQRTAAQPVATQPPEFRADKTAAKFDPYYSADASRPTENQTVGPRTAQQPVESRLRKPLSSQLTQLKDMASRHVVEATSISGHGHEETSLTGISQECQPSSAKSSAAVSSDVVAVPSVAPVPATAFLWSTGDVRTGLVLSEILGRPKALRHNRG
jgi:hypothetical protein